MKEMDWNLKLTRSPSVTSMKPISPVSVRASLVSGGHHEPSSLGPTLRGPLLKKHKTSVASTYGKRFFEVDDSLGCVLLCFRSAEDMHRRMPHHIYPLRGAQVSIQMSDRPFFNSTWGKKAGHAFRLENIGQTFSSLALGHEKLEEVDRWVDGLQRRLDSPRCTSRVVVLQVAEAGKTPAGTSRSGLQLANFSWSPIGVQIINVDPGSAGQRAGLKVGEAIIAVEGVGCLSHVHAAKLLRNSTGISLRGLGSSGVCEIQCIVATEHKSAPWPKDETVEIS